MAQSITFSGIASGLDTTSIIEQLMSIEKLPQAAISKRLTAEENKLSAMQTINTAVQGLTTSASSFLTGSTWKQLAATSSSTAVTVTASATASPANLSMSVNSTATAAKLSFSEARSLTDLVADPASTVSLTLADGSVREVETGDGTLKSLITNLNAVKDSSGKSLVSAASVNMGDGTYKLLLNSASTGAGTLALSGANLALGTTTSVAGTDASIDLGAGLTVTSKTNTFTDVLPGISITLGAEATAGTTSNLSVAVDASGRATAVGALVGQLNSILSTLSESTTYGTIPTGAGQAATDAGMLAGNSIIRGISSQLISTIYTSTGGVLNDLGIEVDRYGKFVFNQTKFTEAYEKDPTKVQDAITGSGGFAERLVSVSRQISGTQGLQSDNSILKADGQLTQLIKQQQQSLRGYSDQISAWDLKLAAKEANLVRMYTSLETTMSKLNAQSSWLQSQIEALDSSTKK